jgi:midasin
VQLLDGRIERDSRDDLRQLVREMNECSILLIMIIVEGDNRKGSMKNKDKDSIVNMKEVSFVNGKPKVKYFIEDYPFPYYMVLQDMNTLPEVLGDALKQWFEMMITVNAYTV